MSRTLAKAISLEDLVARLAELVAKRLHANRFDLGGREPPAQATKAAADRQMADRAKVGRKTRHIR